MNKFTPRKTPAVLSAFLLCLGCSTFNTTKSPIDERASTRLGSYYFLPRGKIHLKGEQATGGGFKVSIERINEPDRAHRYFLKHQPNIFFDDDITLKVNTKGLLETVNITTEDKTPAIIDKITETLIDVARIATNGLALETIAKKTFQPFDYTFDPFIRPEVEDIKKKLKSRGFALELDARGGSQNYLGQNYRTVTSTTSTTSTARQSSFNGVFYRPPTTVKLELVALPDYDEAIIGRTEIRLPDVHRIAVLDLSRSPFIKKKTNLAFADGDFGQLEYNRPSQALGFISIPASIAHKIAEAIPTIIAIQDNRAKRVPPDLAAEKARLDAQKAVLDSQAALIKSEAALRATQSAGGANDAAPLSNEEATSRANAAAARAKAEELKAAAELDKAREETKK